jgi:hypothetical protein
MVEVDVTRFSVSGSGLSRELATRRRHCCDRRRASSQARGARRLDDFREVRVLRVSGPRLFRGAKTRHLEVDDGRAAASYERSAGLGSPLAIGAGIVYQMTTTHRDCRAFGLSLRRNETPARSPADGIAGKSRSALASMRSHNGALLAAFTLPTEGSRTWSDVRRGFPLCDGQAAVIGRRLADVRNRPDAFVSDRRTTNVTVSPGGVMKRLARRSDHVAVRS